MTGIQQRAFDSLQDELAKVKADLSQQDAQMKLLCEIHANERAAWHEQKTTMLDALGSISEIGTGGRIDLMKCKLEGCVETAKNAIAKANPPA